MKKEDALKHWRTLTTRINPLGLMRPIPYKAAGRTYGTDGIRIDGSPEFIDAVLSNLTALIDGENAATRLSLSRSKANSDFKSNPNADSNAEVCYIRLHMRGSEAQAMNTAFDRTGREALERMLALR